MRDALAGRGGPSVTAPPAAVRHSPVDAKAPARPAATPPTPSPSFPETGGARTPREKLYEEWVLLKRKEIDERIAVISKGLRALGCLSPFLMAGAALIAVWIREEARAPGMALTIFLAAIVGLVFGLITARKGRDERVAALVAAYEEDAREKRQTLGIAQDFMRNR
jgi:hypothetical protein